MSFPEFTREELDRLEAMFEAELQALYEMGVDPDSEDNDWWGGFGW